MYLGIESEQKIILINKQPLEKSQSLFLFRKKTIDYESKLDKNNNRLYWVNDEDYSPFIHRGQTIECYKRIFAGIKTGYMFTLILCEDMKKYIEHKNSKDDKFKKQFELA